MKKIILAAAFCAVMGGACLLTGCTDKGADTGVSLSQSDTKWRYYDISDKKMKFGSSIKPADSYTDEECGEFTYKQRGDFHLAEESGITKYYTYGSHLDMVISVVLGNAKTTSTPEALLAYQDEILRGSDEAEGTGEIITGGKYDVSVYIKDLDDESDSSMKYGTYEISAGGKSLVVSIAFKEKESDIARDLALEILESVEYTGDHKDPEETRTIDHEFFTVELSPEFDVQERMSSEEALTIKYTCSDSLSKFLSSFSVSSETDGRYDSAEDYAKSRMNDLISGSSSGKILFTEEPYETEINGIKCWRSVYNRNVPMNFGSCTYVDNYFENGGVLYRVGYMVNKHDGWKDVEKGFEELLGCVEFRELSEDEIAAIEASKTAAYETENFVYELSTLFTYNEEHDYFAGDGIITVSEIYFDENDEDDPYAFARRVVSYDDGDETCSQFDYSKRKIGDNEFLYAGFVHYPDYKDWCPDRSCFLYSENGRHLLVTLELSLDDTDDVFDEKQFMKMLESIRAK